MSVQNGEHVIKMDGVKVQYGDQTVLNDIQFELRNGEFCYLIGKTGSGKTLA
ncbi:MAG: phosphonate ABC transporter ATP-binding protein, partial [Bacteroidetes bacterium]|nr:phosphonate ABC transporter ATP-binding protein [Bacteroidota bacterium]